MTTAWQVGFVAIAALVLLLTAVVIGLMRRVSGALERVEAVLEELASLSPQQGLELGNTVPTFYVKDSSGLDIASDSLWSRGPAVVAFLSHGCEPCQTNDS